MALRTNTVKISGVPGDSGWSQSFEYALDEAGEQNTSLLAIVFSTVGKNTEFDDAVVGRELLNRFREEYFSDKTKNPDNCLKDAVKKIFNEFFQKLDGLEIAAACLSGNNLFAASINGGKVSLYRDNFLVKILDSNTPQLVSASGFPKKNDIVVLATSDFFKNMTFLEIKDSFSKGLDAVKDYFSMKLHGVSTASVALIEFAKMGANEKNQLNNFIDSEAQEVKNGKLKHGIFRKKISGFIDKARFFVPRKGIYLHKERLQTLEVKNKKMMYVGIILTLLLGVSVVFGIYKNKKDIYKSSYTDTLNEAKLNIDNAISLKNVEIANSREALLKGKTLVEKLKNDGVKDPEVGVLEKKILENESEILGERRISSEMWLDLTLILDGFSSAQIIGSGDLVYVFDASKNRVIGIDLATKKSKTIKIADEIKNASSFFVRSNEIYMLTDEGVYENTSKKRVIDKNWEEARFFSLYSSNIYILDSRKGEILKSTGRDNGFSAVKKWSTSDAEDFSAVKSFVIDGFAWVLSGNQIKKYSYGNNIKFELKGYPYDLPQYDVLYSNENAENLYLLSRGAKTISVFDKEGEYKYNLITDIITDAKDFIVSESEGKVILLTGEKLYLLSIAK